MIKTRLAYDNNEIYINPYTISYIIRQDTEVVIGFTNGHTYNVTGNIGELMEVIENETKSLCKECKASIPEE